MSSSDIKLALQNAGFEVYRTHNGVVHVAERVRENLIMDSGVRVDSDALTVSFYARAEQLAFPGENDDDLYHRAHTLGQPALDRGYQEKRRFVTEMTDPGQPTRTLDVWYQIQLERSVDDVAGAINEVRFAFELDKTAKR